MLIIHGVSEKLLNYHEENSSHCPNCNHKGVTYRIVQKYYHIYALPFFPTGKYTGLNCNECNYNSNNIVSKESIIYEKIAKTPIYLYTGTVIFILLLLGILILIFAP